MFVDWIIDAGYDVQRLDAHEDWLSRFKRRLTALPEAEKKQSVLALLKAFERPHSFIPFRGESSNFQDLIATIGYTPADLQLDAAFIYKCLQDLAWRDLIDAPPKMPSPAPVAEAGDHADAGIRGHFEIVGCDADGDRPPTSWCQRRRH